MNKHLTFFTILFILLGLQSCNNTGNKSTSEFSEKGGLSKYLNSYGVYHFQKKIAIDKKPGQFIIHVSADRFSQVKIEPHRGGYYPSRKCNRTIYLERKADCIEAGIPKNRSLNLRGYL
ncbi:MAG: hypothetical protein SH818_00015 [Saprospiraceae bacterium]|nr:hypothetical protein [Saprospiraceae bacterium]